MKNILLKDIVEKPQSGEWGKEDEAGIGVPVIRTTNFTNTGEVNYSKVVTRVIDPKKFEKKVLRKGDIIIEKSGGSEKQPVGRVIYFEGQGNKYLFNNFTSVLRVKDDVSIHHKYLFYYLYRFYKKGGTLRFQNKTTGLHNLKLDQMINGVIVPVIDLTEQERICNTLDNLYKIIKLKQEQLRDYDNLIKSRFVEMFGDISVIGDKWAKGTMGDVVCAIDPQPSHRTPPVSSDGIPYIGMAECNYKTMQIDFGKARKVGSKVMEEHLNRYSIDKGDFIIGKIGTIGKPFFIPTERNYVLSANIVLIKPDNTKISPVFLLTLFKSEFIDRQMIAEKNSSTQPALGIKKVRNINIVVPPLELQNKFEVFAEQVDKLKIEVQKSLDETEMLFDSLMQEYFE